MSYRTASTLGSFFDMRLHVHEWGPSAGRPLLCLHGITSWGGRFRGLAEKRLDEFHVFAPDLRGHGVSDWEPPWSLGSHVADIVDTLNAATASAAGSRSSSRRGGPSA